MTDYFSTIIGHTEVCSIFKKQLEHNTLAQAYLFQGPRSVGKMTLAKAVIQMCGITDLELLTIAPEIGKDSISIDQIRAIHKFVQLKSAKKYTRAIIIDGVARLTAEAANSILKVLEEPPAGTLFFLLAHEDGQYVPTLQSRCQIIQMRAVPRNILDTYLKTHFREHQDHDVLIKYAMGRPGLLLNFLKDKTAVEVLQKKYTQLKNILLQPNADSLEVLAVIFDSKKSYLERKQSAYELHNLLHQIIHDILQQTVASEFQQTKQRLHRVFTASMRQLGQFGYNPDPKMQLMELITRFHY